MPNRPLSQGIGARLVRAFDAAAEARGCRTFYLESYSFQAPGFYRALGYEARLAIDGYAAGTTKFTMVRQVGVPGTDADPSPEASSTGPAPAPRAE